MTRYGLVVDTKQCTGCYTCAVTCKYAYNLPANVWYDWVHTDNGGGAMDAMVGTYPNCSVSYRPVSCMHCDNPACVEVCPTASIEKREDGIVVQNSETCIGCQSCIAACPYEGVRTLVDSEPAFHHDFPMGVPEAQEHLGNTVEKCNLCYKRVDAGEKPYCVEACPARCRLFGDFDDPESDVSKALGGRDYERLMEEGGTEPNIYYLLK